MACTENGLGGHSRSSIMVPVDKNGSRETHHNVQLRCLSSMLKDDEDDADVWPHPPVSLRPSFTMPRTGARIPENPRALRHPFTLAPATEEESLATAEINSSEGQESQSQKGHDSINMSQDVSASPMALMIGGRVGSGILERSGNNSKPYIPVPRANGFFPPRGSQSRGPPYIPTLRSGIMMEVTPGNARMAYKGNLAHVSFPLGSPRHPMDNWQQRPPLPLSTNITGLPCSTAHCFLPPQAPAFNLFPVMPTAFASPLGFGPPLLPYFFHYNTGAIYPPPYLN